MPGRFKHISKFKDRHGRTRVYFRYPGQDAIAIKATLDTPEFEAEYLSLMRRAEAARTEEISPRAARRMRDWSGRRLADNIKGIMADSGVYLLIREGRVVYVGTSKNCAARIAEHRINGRAYDKAFYIYAEESERVELERALIRSLRPEQNKAGKPVSTRRRSLQDSEPNAL